MCKNKIRKKTLASRLKFWILGLILLLFVAVIIVPKVTFDDYGFPIDLKCINMSVIARALNMFKLDNGNYPLSKEGLEALVKNPNPQKYSNYGDDGYIEKSPLDSWGNPYRYNYYKTDKGDDFQLISSGSDRKYGGEGEDADITYPSCHKD